MFGATNNFGHTTATKPAKVVMNLQDSFLNHVRKEGVEVTITMLDGDKVEGVVRGFDNFTVILECGESQKMVYKHAIALVEPSVPVKIMQAERKDWGNIGSL